MVETHKGQILVSHINIRQSISFLLLKLILIDIIFGILVIVFHSVLFSVEQIEPSVISFNPAVFIIILVLKLGITLFIVLQWLNDYYEITPTSVIHKYGLIWRHIQEHPFKHIRSIKISQGAFGKLLNYGTLEVYNWDMQEYVTLYLIHNPQRYLEVLQSLVPETDQQKDVFRETLGEND